MNTSFKQWLKYLIGPNRLTSIRQHRGINDGLRIHGAEFEARDNAPSCYLIGSPDYPNLGDLAIAEAEVAFLEERFDGGVMEIPTGRLPEYLACLRRYADPSKDVICLQGGGNMGDLYPSFEWERDLAIEELAAFRIVLMPQTISYTDPDSPLLAYTRKIYAKAPRLTLFARETTSEAIMKREYPKARVGLVPDIVLSLDAAGYLDDTPARREGILTLLRDDAEKATDRRAAVAVDEALRATGLAVTRSDTMVDAPRPVLPEARYALLAAKLRQIAASRLTVTDRLHGMVFAAITGTPCLVMTNSNHKVRGVYQWIRDLPYVRFVEGPGMIGAVVDELLNLPDGQAFPRETILKEYEPLARAVAKEGTER